MEWVAGITTVALVGICLKLATGKVSRHECNANINAIKIENKYLREKIDDIKEDTKEILRRNGGKRD